MMRLTNVFSVSAAFGLTLGAAALVLPGAARAPMMRLRSISR